MRPHQATDYMTKMTAVAPSGDCPLWRKFLQQIFDKDNELISYMQRVCGYALTGETREHALFFDYGVGANGKGTFLNTIGKILASYHVSSSIETFTVRGQDQHPTELAKLHGARLVTVAETEQGRRWAESRIKQLTGGDPVDARFMRQDFFTYYPQFKLMVSGNHKPQLRSTNEAIRRRINLIPFKVIIPPKERDLELADKLKAEWAGILVWMIKGCLDWQQKGLMPPKAVIDATTDYLASEDVMGRWLEDYCIQHAQAWSGSTELFQSWQTWATANSEFIGSQTKFSTNLEERGFKKVRKQSMGFTGLRLNPLKQQPELPLQQSQPSTDSKPSTANKTLTVILIRETEAAFLVAVNNNTDNAVWLPKSKIVVLQSDGITMEISVPIWLYCLPDKKPLREPKPDVPESDIPF